jgi:hypothetical protein
LRVSRAEIAPAGAAISPRAEQNRRSYTMNGLGARQIFIKF